MANRIQSDKYSSNVGAKLYKSKTREEIYSIKEMKAVVN